MIVNNAKLAAVAAKPSQYPSDGKPEIAFVGKSNVGKSSLINTMLGRRALARTSSQPGKTRTINFYDVEDKLYFVDLPGYGYAKVSKTEQEKWVPMIETYLKKREELKFIIMLVDIRHEPGNNDKMMYEWLKHYGFEIIIVATKQDKLSKNQVNKSLSVIKKAFNLKPGEILMGFSSETKQGKEEVWKLIEERLCEKEDRIDLEL